MYYTRYSAVLGHLYHTLRSRACKLASASSSYGYNYKWLNEHESRVTRHDVCDEEATRRSQLRIKYSVTVQVALTDSKCGESICLT